MGIIRSKLARKFLSCVAVSAMIFGVCSKVCATTLRGYGDLFVSGNNNLNSYNSNDYNYNVSSRGESYSSWEASSNLRTTDESYLYSDLGTVDSFYSNSHTRELAWDSFKSDNWYVENNEKIVNQVNNTRIDNSRANINNTNFDYSNNYNTNYNTDYNYNTNYNTSNQYNTDYNTIYSNNYSNNSSYNYNNGYYNGGYGY